MPLLFKNVRWSMAEQLEVRTVCSRELSEQRTTRGSLSRSLNRRCELSEEGQVSLALAGTGCRLWIARSATCASMAGSFGIVLNALVASMSG
mmetsp:Transcript_174449/g.559210  ORF Transcript_174449/g.559210 Transcript_174449/m.559210 type:complete len:92 (+) Transcript_174449:758-1033(+)